MDILKSVENIYPQAVEWRRHLHAHPELSGQEVETSKYICSILDELGISYKAEIGGHGVVAQIGHGNKAIGIRADIDALPVSEDTGLDYSSVNPGIMHACGHDMHAAILLGTGALLKEIEEEIDAMDGAIKLFFQPAEEGIGGAQPMINDGCMENPKVERVIALHVDPSNDLGTVVLKYGAMNAQTQGFRLKVIGKSCHGAHPEGGIDAIVMASEMVTALQTIPSRYNAPTTPCIVTVGTFHGGNAGNIVAGEVEMTGTLRALESSVMDRNKELFEQISSGIASAYGGSIELTWDDDFYPALINDDQVTSLIEECTRELFGEEALRFMPEPSLGGDDFAFFNSLVPGSYFNIGTTPVGEEWYSLHNEHYAPKEEAMKTGIAIEVTVGLKLLKEICK